MTKKRETGNLTFEEVIKLAERVEPNKWKPLKGLRQLDRSTQFLRENPKERIYFHCDSYWAITSTDPKYKIGVTLRFTYNIGLAYIGARDSISELFTGMLNVKEENKIMYDCCFQERRPECIGLRDPKLIEIINLHKKISPHRREI